MLWLAGAFADGEARTALWLAALAIDYVAPLVLYWVPGRPKLGEGTWEVETAHFAERFQLFLIIALGETIVIIGATTAELELGTARLAALGLAFLSTAALWWLYFDFVARIAERRLELAAERTRLARDGYTYLHVVIVAGVILSGIGDELVIAHPTDSLPAEEVAVVAAGPALYLLALALFRLRMAGSIAWKRLAGARRLRRGRARALVGARARPGGGARGRPRRRDRGRAGCGRHGGAPAASRRRSSGSTPRRE